ncbi:hypothetical protein BH09ACT12_BH09ACT12_32710 [soil metagenome]
MAGPEFAMLTTDDLVTGEAVALDLPPAGLAIRIASGLIDVVVTLLLLVVLALVFGIATIASDDAIASIAVIAVIVLVFVGFPTTLETLTRGRSLGKLATGLRTVRDDAGPISFQHALIRSLIGFMEIYLFSGVPAFFSMLVNSRGKRLGDFAAGTYVVRSRVSLMMPLPTQMPYQLAGWATGADVASLPTGLALAVRQYLARSRDFDPASRAAVGGRLADQVSAYAAPLPPAGTAPDDFLAAVVATRRERDLQRLRRQDDARRRLTAPR